MNFHARDNYMNIDLDYSSNSHAQAVLEILQEQLADTIRSDGSNPEPETVQASHSPGTGRKILW
jgi:hypothetical protein